MISYYPLPYPLKASQVFEQLRSLGQAVILDSCHPDSRYGRFDLITAAPSKTLQLTTQGLEIREGESSWQPSTEEAFSLLKRWVAELGDLKDQPAPFNGGLIGYFGYDLNRHLEQLPSQAKADIDLPDLVVGLYLQAVVIDHQQGKSWLMVHVLADEAVTETFLSRLAISPADVVSADTDPFRLTEAFSSNMSATDYRHALERIHAYIQAGDCYQINLAQRFTAPCQGDPWQAWKSLRQVAPTPFAAYLDLDQGALLSLSPERFLSCDNNGRVETRPIKGTRPRGTNSLEDAQLAAELINSDKDRAENVMIVDLLRNDLSKVCQPGSVEVPELFALESYPNVHHLVSSVTGQLENGFTPLDLLRECFPGGSITGAPKIRAMEIIDELEPHRRSAYCGSIAYLSACGRMDSSITIRTLVCSANKIHCWAGGGIVADSDIDAEYAETFSKVNNLLNALQNIHKY
ncbi:aminodeoxychorismate synthase component I [Nitrincola sp.]|uniref:aminodeoxychorismate synthase component I n=1 Tax=Nitrincola sp. TaxID=1926584 RepID=UPI003A8E3B3B